MSSVRAFFSGIEGDQHFNAAVESGAVHVLTSYYYMREKNDMDILKRRHQRHPHLRFMIDSGAHSFQIDKAGKFHKWSMTDWENYLEAYTDWLRANKQHVFSAVELDIESVVKSQAIIEKWQDKYFRPLEEEGIDIIYVWHPQLGWDYWEKMCAKHAYVGLPGELSKEANFNSYFTVARKWVNKIHGFAASVTGDTKVVVQDLNGVVRNIPIETLYKQASRYKDNGHESWAYLATPHQTWTLTDDLKSEYRPLSAVVKHKVNKAIYEIVLRGGKTVRGTEDHSFFCLDRLGNLKETKPCDMTPGDHLVSSLGIPANKESNVSLNDAEFLGVWFGDGYVKSALGVPRAICCSKQQQSEIREVCERTAKQHGGKWTVTPGTVDGSFTNTSFAKWIVLKFGRTAEDKRIGSTVLSWAPPEQAAFLRGYFSADGSCKGVNKLISLSCKDRSVLETVQLMLEHWDIRSGITDAGYSGLGFHSWELAISDNTSRELFAKHIGFLQSDQNQALLAKNGTKSVAGCHRGLPVSLLRTPQVFRKCGNNMRGVKPPSTLRSRSAEIPENFCQKLLSMEAEYLEIVSVTKISEGLVEVYDLEVPATERFFANGILAHNTRQADYRDWPWYSIDSTSWKASEIYGLLMHWDDRRQKISYIEDKAKRAMFRRDFEKYGLDAEAIIRCGIHPNPHASEEEKKAYNRRSYMHITKYALITFRRMEAFYEERYKDNTQYYEMRLPHPKFLLQRIDRKQATKVWERWRPKDLFAQHAEETDPGTIRKILFGLSCVQYQRLDLLGPVSRAFLQTYFASHMDAKPVNSAAVALDLALRSAPPNPQPMRRESAEDFADSAFTLHKRELSDWGELDYGPEDFPDHLLSLLTND